MKELKKNNENVLFQKTKLIFNSEKILNKRPIGNRCSKWGTMHLLLYLMILKDIENGVISPDQELTFTKEVQHEFGTLRSTRGQYGEKRLLSDVLNQAISFNAPDCISALYEVYGGFESAKGKIYQLALMLNVSVFSRLVPTGRKNGVQLSNIYDYYKIGLAFLELSATSHYFIKNRSHVIHGETYTPPIDFSEDASILSSIFWGTNQNDCFIFRRKSSKIECSLIINGESVEDILSSALDDNYNWEGLSPIKLEEERYDLPFSEWLSNNFEGYFLNEKIAKKNNKVDHVIQDLSMIDLRGFDNVAVVSLSASHYRSLIPSTTRSFHSNILIEKFNQKDKISFIITDEPIKALMNEIPQFIVPDSLLFSYEYISYMSEIYKGKSIGITGSAGKSSTRLMLSHLLSDDGNVLENISNANMHYPTFSLSLGISNKVDFIVYEGAASSMNPLAYGNNSYLWRPDVAIITSFGSAHAGVGIQRNLRVKKQIFYGVKEGGYAVINGDIDQEYLKDIIEVAKSLNLTICLYSLEDQTVNCYLKNKIVMKDGTEVKIILNDKEITFILKTDSDGQIQNAMASLLALECTGHGAENYASKFSSYESFDRILRPKEQLINNKMVTLVDDTHNSSIEATINGIKYFSSKKHFYTGSSVLVLGEVADLANQTKEQHKRLEPFINSSLADNVILYGEPFKCLEVENSNVVHCETKEQVVDEIKKAVTEDSYIFVKGSHGIGFYKVVDMLQGEKN
ncbi:Mur ligase family protein [Enterococcus sp. AZ196]|uniref:Mur ligase family protein n=1 Tax=Enterococcus sp. AZ196 TaxID=2774659 RepID=UPI003D2E7169